MAEHEAGWTVAKMAAWMVVLRVEKTVEMWADKLVVLMAEKRVD